MTKYLLFNIGCLECGVDSNVVGIFDTKLKADVLRDELRKKFAWRQGGQNEFEIFELNLPINEINEEYKPKEGDK